MTTDTRSTKGQLDKVTALVRKHPGLDAIALKGKGYRFQTHGSLRDAERTGILTYRNGGWYVAELGEALGVGR